ncbi:MAG: dihydropteroate synthase [Betaproteobacteria bacterium]|nr:dihydropteroate synthase [Betaproteobacteria bacterium]MBI2961413.1 dihydropteroate synthase [Betaproteobacteria bacterium]
MAVVNVTPDSFSDGGEFLDPERAIAHAQRLIEEGADLLEVGGESTRPGAQAVEAAEEWRRIEPVLRALREVKVPVAVDTMKAEVMSAALDTGASMINDVNALRSSGALAAVCASGAAVCLMHMLGTPRTMQVAPYYDDVVAVVRAFLRERIAAAEAGGIARARIVADPGFGFGKTVAHNLELLRRLPEMRELGVPLMAGLSRKSVLGAVTGRPVGERLAASVAAALLAVERGARIVRVHDVAATRDALAVLAAVKGTS